MSAADYYAPNQQVVRGDGSGPAEQGDGGSERVDDGTGGATPEPEPKATEADAEPADDDDDTPDEPDRPRRGRPPKAQR